MAIKKIISTFSLVLLFFFAHGQENSISLLFTGDVMQHDSQINAAYYKGEGYNYNPVFKYIKPVFQSHDLVIANLELTLAGPPYKGYPQFSAPDELAVALQNSGVDILVTANNHSNDRRKKGVIRTLDVLDSLGINHTGTFRNKEERDELYPLIIEKSGFKIAFLNYTYGTNGIPDSPPVIVNRLDKEQITADLKKARNSNVDKIIVVVHWGAEYRRLPGQDQLKWEKLFYDYGADAIIGMHPHVIQPVKRTFNKTENEEKITAYSLGNFVSNQRKRYTDGGMLFSLEIEKSKIDNTIRFGDAGYYLTWVYKEYFEGLKRFYIIPADKMDLINSLKLNGNDKSMINTFLTDSRSLLNKNNYRVSEKRYSPLLDNFLVTRSYKLLDYKPNYKGELNIHTSRESESDKISQKNTPGQFFVQIAALKDESRYFDLPNDHLEKLVVHKEDNGLFKYRVGPFLNKQEAMNSLKKIKEYGYTEAFLITY
ncbi:CapA family protein [Mangrovivirga cuniculi]|uniref:Capsule biosynthesis protein CapA n=1 Tax=Mangrovivirga cuniculi TaxID=2715131 RepID=A0A4D7JTY4_9BACT|nr:CapA family protein [Mangrovivirga cuniculi]QCK14355.1 capsule biosynthesis protein CapA [Mangrovivirga cuniculi]